jgi:hypothetical protein
MSLCAGIRADGERCRAQAMSDSPYCLNHAPNADELRRRRNSRGGRTGGRGRASVELHRLRHRLEVLADKVEDDQIDPRLAAISGQLLNYARGCIRDALVARDQEQVLEEMEEIREALAASEAGRRPGGA